MGKHTGLWPQAPFVRRSLDVREIIRRDQERRGRQGRLWRSHDPAELLALFEHVGIGMEWTPGRLGLALMVTIHRDRGIRTCLPSMQAAQLLKQHSLFEHWELPARGAEWEDGPDIEAAYPSNWTQHPDGTAVQFGPTVPAWLVTWFGDCTVVVNSRLPVSPFRVGRSWPREPGEYRCWLWREKAEDCKEAGCFVRVHGGIGWRRWTDDGSWWSDTVRELRQSAPGGPNGMVGKMVKDVANHAIGLHGCGPWREAYRETWRPGMRPATNSEGVDAGGYERIRGRRTLIHWQRYTVMQTARQVYRLALPYAQRGELAGIELDKVLVVKRTETEKTA